MEGIMQESDKQKFAKSFREALEDIKKAGKGAGSRGGKVIGTTRSGKPIYATLNHKGHDSFNKPDHADAAAVHHHRESSGRHGRDHEDKAGSEEMNKIHGDAKGITEQFKKLRSHGESLSGSSDKPKEKKEYDYEAEQAKLDRKKERSRKVAQESVIGKY